MQQTVSFLTKKMIPHFPPLEITTQDTLGTLSVLLAQRALPIAAVPATSTIAAYLVEERRCPYPSLEYTEGAPRVAANTWGGPDTGVACHDGGPCGDARHTLGQCSFSRRLYYRTRGGLFRQLDSPPHVADDRVCHQQQHDVSLRRSIRRPSRRCRIPC